MRKRLQKLLPDHEAIRGNRWLMPFQSWLLHPRLWHLNRHSAPGAVAVGLFCGLIPGPFQMLGAAIAAVAFRVNLPLAMFTTLYTNPLTLVPLYLLAYEIGRFVIGDGRVFASPPEFAWNAAWLNAIVAWMADIGRPLGLGLLLLAIGFALAGYFAMKAAWRLYIVMAWRRRRRR